MGKYQADKLSAPTPGARIARPAKEPPAGARRQKKPVRRRILTLLLLVAATLTAALALAIIIPPAQVARPGPTENPGLTLPSELQGGGQAGPEATARPTEPPATEPPLVRREDFYTFLLLGTHDDYNTDTIMLASLDLSGDTPKANIISIPRDSQIDVSWNIKRINGTYGVSKGGKAGAAAMMDKVAEVCGVYPDFYAVVNIKSFTKIVDLVGGVPFYIPYDMVQDKPDNTPDPTQHYKINMPRGQYTLNAEDALNVVRYRGTGRADYGRIDIQKDFLLALVKRVISRFSVDKIPGLVDTVVSSIQTNLPAHNMVWFYLNGVSKMDLDQDVALYTLPDLGPGKYEGQHYVFLDRAGIVEMVNRTVNPYTTPITEKMLNIIQLGTLDK